MEYQIITDSTGDYNLELVRKLNIRVIPFGYTIMGESYKNEIENPELTTHEFYDVVKNGNMPKTTQINVSEFIEYFTPVLEGNKDILYISFSKALSGSYNQALIAKKQLEVEYPERNILIIDSQAASMGEGLLVYLACLKKNEGLNIFELRDWIENNKLNIWHWFTVDDINHLKRGGRLTNSQAIIAKTLKIKPVLYVDGLGRLISKNKCIGRKAAINRLFEYMKENYVENTPVFISHADCLEDANYLKGLISRLNIGEIIISTIGPVIGAHAGYKTVALFYLGKNKRQVKE